MKSGSKFCKIAFKCNIFVWSWTPKICVFCQMLAFLTNYWHIITSCLSMSEQQCLVVSQPLDQVWNFSEQQFLGSFQFLFYTNVDISYAVSLMSHHEHQNICIFSHNYNIYQLLPTEKIFIFQYTNISTTFVISILSWTPILLRVL